MKTTQQFRHTAETYRHDVFSFSRYLVGNREDAEDVTQEVLVRLWKHLDTLEEASVKPWLIKVTRNACFDLLRKRTARWKVMSDSGYEKAAAVAAASDSDPAQRFAQAELGQRLEEALDGLSEPYKSIVVLREIQQMTYDEISASLELPLSSVRVYLHRGRRRLRELLTEKVVRDER